MVDQNNKTWHLGCIKCAPSERAMLTEGYKIVLFKYNISDKLYFMGFSYKLWWVYNYIVNKMLLYLVHSDRRELLF